jgi:hypothetical protein
MYEGDDGDSPPPTSLAQQELNAIQAAAQAWNNTSPGERDIPNNECSDQNANLRRAISLNSNYQYWSIRTGIVEGSIGHIFYHNVISIVPMNGNTMPTQIVDGWHYWDFQSSRCVTVEPLSQWQSTYAPNQEVWYNVLLDWLAQVPEPQPR